MDDRVCCVCDEPVPDDAEMVRGRWFCASHRARIGRDRTALWVSSAVVLVGLLLFALLVHWLVGRTQLQLSGPALIAVGAVCALVPALLWLVVFYLQDHVEPEPRRCVLGVFLAGGALALLVAEPVVRDLFHVQEWLPRTSWPLQLLGSVLIVGFAQEYCKYAAVRYRFTTAPSTTSVWMASSMARPAGWGLPRCSICST